jgi:hypothetical protein
MHIGAKSRPPKKGRYVYYYKLGFYMDTICIRAVLYITSILLEFYNILIIIRILLLLLL